MRGLFLRAWLQVALVALNTYQIAHLNFGGAAAVGFAISWVWWDNSDANRPKGRTAQTVYALGAALGTVTGMGVPWALTRLGGL